MKNNFFEKIFSVKGLLVLMACLALYWVFFYHPDKIKKRTTYNTDNAPIGVSDGFNPDAVKQLGIDLTQNLDPQLIPSIVEQSLKKTAQDGVAEKDFIPVLIKSVSNRIQEISTIDLNHDDLSDPILVVPENFSEKGEYFQLSIRVPDPAEVTQLPSSTDQEAWKKIATEQSIEVLTTSVVREGKDQMTVQSTPSSQLYPQSVGAPYYQHHFGLGEMLLTSMLVHSFFRPPLFSPFGYGYQPMMSVGSIGQSRGSYMGGLSRANASTQPISKGGQELGKATRPPSTKSLNSVKSAAYAKSSRSQAGGGGFGGKQSATTSTPRGKSFGSPSQPRPSRSFGGFGSGRSRGFGGGGFGRRR